VYYAGARGDAGAASGAVYAVRVVKQWGPTALAPDWTTWELDLTPHCSEAGQYEVDFVNTGGSGLRVQSAVLVHGGAEAPEFIRPAGRRNAYQVNITGLGVRIVLRVVVRAGRGADSYGQVSIRRAGV
jgi:hypothetical protein